MEAEFQYVSKDLRNKRKNQESEPKKKMGFLDVKKREEKIEKRALQSQASKGIEKEEDEKGNKKGKKNGLNGLFNGKKNKDEKEKLDSEEEKLFKPAPKGKQKLKE